MVEACKVMVRVAAALVRISQIKTQSQKTVKRILVCAAGGLGNTILLIPLLRTLKRAYSGVEVDLIVTSTAAFQLASESKWADQVIKVDGQIWDQGLRAASYFGQVVRKRRYDMVLRTFLTAIGTMRTSFAVYLSGAPTRVAYGSDKVRYFETSILKLNEQDTEVERHLKLASVLGIKADSMSEWEDIVAPQPGRSWGRQFLREEGLNGTTPILGVHPGCDANFKAKRWRASKFAEVVVSLARKRGCRTIVFAGPDDLDVARRVVTLSGGAATLAHGQSIVETAGLIAHCSAFVSNDSGLMHLASASGIPTVALFGPTDPVKNRPLGRDVTIVKMGLDCSPCDHETATLQCAHHLCLESLEVKEALSAVERALDRGGRSTSETLISSTKRPDNGGGG